MPTIISICVGQEADVRITIQFDYPMRRGFYAKSPDQIENEFKKIRSLVGKPCERTRVMFVQHIPGNKGCVLLISHVSANSQAATARPGTRISDIKQ